MVKAWLAGVCVAFAAGCTGDIASPTALKHSAQSAQDAGASESGDAQAAAGSGGAMSAAGSGGADPADSVANEGSEPAQGGPHDTYYVQNGKLYDRCGEKVVLRGVNHPTLELDRPGKALPEIAKTGANAVRLVWYATRDVPITEADAAISQAIAQHMLPILEMHDATCGWDTEKLDQIERYWTTPEAVALLQKYEANLIVNLANEASAPNAPAFKLKYSSMLKSLRNAGVHVPVMIDGADCGRDYDMLLAQGPALLEADPDHNVLFSAHLYNPLSASELSKVYDDFAQAKLTLVIGAFSSKQPMGCGASLDYKTLIAQAQKSGVGWLAWSWGDDNASTQWNKDCGELDMTETFAFDSLTGWGKEVAVTLPESVMNTSVRPRSLTTGVCP